MHGNKPHTPEDCPIELRAIQEIREHYVANVLDDTGKGSSLTSALLAGRGKFHMSIVRNPIFPTVSLKNVVPPVLHITLDIVLKLFKILLGNVKSQDIDSNEPSEESQARANDWSE